MKYPIFYSCDIAKYNGYEFRLDKTTGYYLSTKKIGERRKRLHCYVWETETENEIPSGYAIHHKDHNKNNNEIDNLQIVTSSEHAKIHGQALTEEQKIARKNNIIQNVIPKSVEWHKSEDGREWHKEHYEQMKDKWYKKDKFVCEFCGKEYIATVTGKNRFCSNNCKSNYRRINGLDNEIRKCECCGKGFFTNKYSKAKCCSRECASIIRKSKKHTA